MTKQLQQIVTIEYGSIFNDTPKPVSEYLKGLEKKDIITAFCFLIAKQHEGLSHKDIINMFFSPANDFFKNHVLKQCAILSGKVGEIGLLSPLTLYRLCEMALEFNGNVAENISKEDFERNVFLAIIAQNQENSVQENNAAISCSDLSDDFKVPAMLFSQSFPSYDLINYQLDEVMVTQLIRAIYLFEFLSMGDDKTKGLLQDFCQYYGYPNWQEYLKVHLSLILTSLKKATHAHTELAVTKDANFHNSCNFLDKLAILDSENISDYDYVRLRTTPLYKQDVGKYLIISDLFLIESLFKGIFFKLSEINNVNKAQGRPSFENFRSYYCDYFSEQHLLYSILDNIYHNYIHLGGRRIKELTGLEAEPDYYLRNGKYLYLFESKDILINKTIKGSYDFSKYRPELKKRLHKAVSQLTKNICRIMDKEFSFDTNYNPEKLIIHPVIVLHDRCYDTPGLNKIINRWFTEELGKLDGAKYDLKNIKPVTIINIDTLLLLHNQLKNRSLSLHDLIKDYHRKTILTKRNYKDESHLMQSLKNSMFSFSDFAEHLVTRMQMHPKLKGFAKILFSD